VIIKPTSAAIGGNANVIETNINMIQSLTLTSNAKRQPNNEVRASAKLVLLFNMSYENNN
jgi:hypothetical protein